MASVLLIEDNFEVANALVGFLRQRGYLVEHTNHGLEGLKIFHTKPPDVLLLDIMMPGLTGLEVLRQVRETSQIPVLVLTARADEREILEGFALGADDYITKPFRMLEVLARLQAVLRRVKKPSENLVTAHGLSFQLEARMVSLNNQTLELTLAEYDLLLRLVQHPNRVFKRSELVEITSNERETLERTVDTHIKNLRKKLGANHHLETVYGIGYRYET